MTLIIATKGKDHIVLGVDSRGIFSDFEGGSRIITDIHEKMTQLNKYTTIMIAGDAEKGVYLIEKFKKSVTSEDGVTKITENFSKFCQKEFKPLRDFIAIESKLYPVITFIIAGMDKVNRRFTKPRLYILRSKVAFALGEKRDYATDGKDAISQYLFAKYYKKDNSADKKLKLIVKCLFETEKYDGEAGGLFHTAIINERDGFQEKDNTSIRAELENEQITEILSET